MQTEGTARIFHEQDVTGESSQNDSVDGLSGLAGNCAMHLFPDSPRHAFAARLVIAICMHPDFEAHHGQYLRAFACETTRTHRQSPPVVRVPVLDVLALATSA